MRRQKLPNNWPSIQCCQREDGKALVKGVQFLLKKHGKKAKNTKFHKCYMSEYLRQHDSLIIRVNSFTSLYEATVKWNRLLAIVKTYLASTALKIQIFISITNTGFYKVTKPDQGRKTPDLHLGKLQKVTENLNSTRKFDFLTSFQFNIRYSYWIFRTVGSRNLRLLREWLQQRITKSLWLFKRQLCLRSSSI